MPYSPELMDEVIKQQDIFVWEAPAWEHRERGPRWYLIMSAIAAVGVIYAVLTSNFLFAFLILLGAVILVLAGNLPPKRILVQVGRNGVVVNGKLYEFPDIENFSIVYQPPQSKVLYLELKSVVTPRLRILLEEQNPLELRGHLRQFVRENLDLQDEHLSDIVARLLKI